MLEGEERENKLKKRLQLRKLLRALDSSGLLVLVLLQGPVVEQRGQRVRGC